MNNDFIQELYRKNQLEKREIDLILCHFLAVNSAGLMIYNDSVSKALQQSISSAIQQRQQGMPLAYIKGTKGFWTLELKVNKHTLIPRPETEQMIELILDWTNNDFSGNILDLGTGTGAIALSIAQQRPKASVTAIDFSIECIKVAQFNKEKYKLNNVSIFQSNWFENLKDKTFDFILSNPPYVAENDVHLQDLKYEPITALTAKKNGLADLQLIIQEARKHLKPKGKLLLEHGYNQQPALHTLLEQNHYNLIKTYKDLAGIPRITTAGY